MCSQTKLISGTLTLIAIALMLYFAWEDITTLISCITEIVKKLWAKVTAAL